MTRVIQQATDDDSITVRFRTKGDAHHIFMSDVAGDGWNYIGTPTLHRCDSCDNQHAGIVDITEFGDCPPTPPPRPVEVPDLGRGGGG